MEYERLVELKLQVLIQTLYFLNENRMAQNVEPKKLYTAEEVVETAEKFLNFIME